MANQKTAYASKGYDAEVADLAVSGDCTIAGDLDVSGTLTSAGEVVSGVLTGSLEITGSLDVDTNINCDGNLVLDGTALLSGVATLSETPVLAKGITLTEQGSDISAPAANGGVLYLKDNGSGKTLLCVRFASGAVQTIATQP